MKAKKTILIVAAMLLVAALSIGGTLAYLTAKTEVVKNTFTVGNIQLKLDEAKVEYNDETDKWVTVDPATRVTANTYTRIKPADVLPKDPTVTVLANSEDCYVRVFVTVEKASEIDSVLPKGTDLTTLFQGYDADKWAFVAAERIYSEDGTFDRVYEFRYAEVVPFSTANQALEPIFTSVVIPSTITNAQLTAINGFGIDVIAQAIQAGGFNGDAEAAFAKLPNYAALTTPAAQ